MSFEPQQPLYNASDPHATFLNASCFDFLLIEIVPLAQRVAEDLVKAPEHSTKSSDEDVRRDIVFRRLEALGYRVGQGLVERCCSSISGVALGEPNFHSRKLTPARDSLAIVPDLQITLMLSNSCAKIFGHSSSESR